MEGEAEEQVLPKDLGGPLAGNHGRVMPGKPVEGISFMPTVVGSMKDASIDKNRY